MAKLEIDNVRNELEKDKKDIQNFANGLGVAIYMKSVKELFTHNYLILELPVKPFFEIIEKLDKRDAKNAIYIFLKNCETKVVKDIELMSFCVMLALHYCKVITYRKYSNFLGIKNIMNNHNRLECEKEFLSDILDELGNDYKEISEKYKKIVYKEQQNFPAPGANITS